jgi:hypothetical protein
MNMRSHEIIPAEEAKQPSPCHPDRGSEGAPNFVIPTEGAKALPILSSRPRAIGPERRDLCGPIRSPRQNRIGRRPSASAHSIDSSTRPSASLGMTSLNVVPTEDAKRPQPCHPNRGSEGAPNFVIPPEGAKAPPILSSRPRAIGPERRDLCGPIRSPRQSRIGRRPSASAHSIDSSTRPSASLGMTSLNVVPTEDAKRPPPCHPNRGSEGALNFVIPTEGAMAPPILSSRPRAIGPERRDLFGPNRSPRQSR